MSEPTVTLSSVADALGLDAPTAQEVLDALRGPR